MGLLGNSRQHLGYLEKSPPTAQRSVETADVGWSFWWSLCGIWG
jgi:hypothetical protein